MGTTRSEADAPLLFSTHSSHKMLAAFSQASMIHVQDGGQRRLDVPRFNEAFMMHTSTSPQYGILASLDVASAMMEGAAGRSLIQETFDEALAFRRALANLRRNLPEGDWWFDIWQPPGIEARGASCAADWVLAPGADWHGFGELAADYVLLDPLKVTLVMPGLTAGGRLDRGGHSGAGARPLPLGARGGGGEDRPVLASWCCSPWASPRASGAPWPPSCWSSSACTTATRRWSRRCPR